MTRKTTEQLANEFINQLDLLHRKVRGPAHHMNAVRRGLAEFIHATQVDELMITGQIYDHAARVKSYEITMEQRAKLTSDKQRRAG